MYTEFMKAYPDEVNPGLSFTDLSSFEESLQPLKLTDEIKELYAVFDGTGELPRRGIWILELQDALEVKRNYESLFKANGQEFPSALFPIAGFNEGNYWVPLTIFPIIKAPVFEYAVAHGDTEIYLMYDSVGKFIETLLLEKEICDTNKYPEYSEHYVDEEAVKAVQSNLNKNMYHHAQKGNKSKSGIVNVYEISSFASAWSEQV